MKQKIIVWLMPISVLGAIILLLSLISIVRSQTHQQCVAIEQLKSYTESAIIRGKKTLPTISYYKEHPKELQVQLDSINQTEKDFGPKQC